MRVLHILSVKVDNLLGLSVIASFLLIVQTAFGWILFDLLLFFEFLLMLFIYAFFLLILIFSIIVGVKRFKHKQKKAFLPLLINCVSLLVVIVIPLSEITLKTDFVINLKRREMAVEILMSNLTPTPKQGYETVSLPSQYRHLSRGGGEVIVEQDNDETNILFFTVRGVTDNFSGFVYRSTKSEPERNFFWCDYVQYERINSNWYFISCT